jgi:outer membrane protein assembly factor BamE (lipoprotein component of BamABCDE complex)
MTNSIGLDVKLGGIDASNYPDVKDTRFGITYIFKYACTASKEKGMRKALPWKHLILGFTALLMAGCASGSARSVGRMIDTTHVKDIQQGQSKEQIRAWFGAPYSTNVSEKQDNQGRPQAESWTYFYGWSDGSSSKSKTLIVVFDRNGRVIERAFNQK